MALSRGRITPVRSMASAAYPVAAGAVIHAGGITCANAAGYAVPGAADAALAFLGCALEGVDNSAGPDGARWVVARRDGEFLWKSAPGADAVTEERFGRACWILDDETVAGSDDGGTRPAAGIVSGIESGPAGRLAWVRPGAAAGAAATPSGAGPALAHSPAVNPAAERLGVVQGQIRGSVILDISDISAFTAINAGTLVIGGVAAQGIDLSAATTINEVVNTISAAVQAALPTYTVSLDYINPSFYGRIIRSDGDVPAVSGTLEPLFGFAPPAATVQHVAASPSIILPAPPGGGEWRHLSLRFLGQSYRTQYWYCRSDFWLIEGEGSLSSYLLLSNTGGWSTQSFADAAGGTLQVAAASAYSVEYFEILYDPAAREISWQPAPALPTSANWAPSIDTLAVLGS